MHKWIAVTNFGRRLVALFFWKSPTRNRLVTDKFHRHFGSEILQPYCQDLIFFGDFFFTQNLLLMFLKILVPHGSVQYGNRKSMFMNYSRTVKNCPILHSLNVLELFLNTLRAVQSRILFLNNERTFFLNCSLNFRRGIQWLISDWSAIIICWGKVVAMVTEVAKIVSEYDQEIPQSQTADKSVAPRGRAAQPNETRVVRWSHHSHKLWGTKA